MKSQVIEKAIDLVTAIFKRVFTPEQQEAALKIAITKKKMVALEAAEKLFLNLDIDWINAFIKLEEKKDKKYWEKQERLFRSSKNSFFKNNN